jgi:single-strand DNA-binding protein
MYQKILIIGNLGRDPEMRYMADGTAVTSFSVATTSRWTEKSSGQPKEETTWFRISVWGRQGETANQYLRKGSKVLVEGRLKPDPETGAPRIWTRQDGTVGASFEVTADTVRFLDTKSDSGGGSNAPANEYGSPSAVQEEDDIPF